MTAALMVLFGLVALTEAIALVIVQRVYEAEIRGLKAENEMLRHDGNLGAELDEEGPR